VAPAGIEGTMDLDGPRTTPFADAWKQLSDAAWAYQMAYVDAGQPGLCPSCGREMPRQVDINGSLHEECPRGHYYRS
jgi:hypothetical protein